MFSWFRRGRAAPQTQKPDVAERPACEHTVLVPRWDALEDMGKPERAIGYKCDGCGQDFTREEGQELLEHGSRLL